MADIPKKARERLTTGLKRYRKVLEEAKTRDVNESDTVTIVRDMLSDVFGFDKYSEISSEYAIRNSFCDLAIKVNNKPALLIEVKAIGLDLKENHLKQARSYALEEGVDWCILTNGAVWEAHRVHYNKPVSTKLVFRVNLLEDTLRSDEILESLFAFTKEGVQKDAIRDLHERKAALSRHLLAAVILQEPVLTTIRREIRRVADGLIVTKEEVSSVLQGEVLKRETLEGEEAAAAHRKVSRVMRRATRDKDKAQESATADKPEPVGAKP